jgi:transposase
MGKAPVKSVEDKNRIVLAVLRGEISIAAAARRENTSQTSISNWRDLFLSGGLVSCHVVSSTKSLVVTAAQ